MRVVLGNGSARDIEHLPEADARAAHEDADDPRVLAPGVDAPPGSLALSRPARGHRATLAILPEGTSLGEALAILTGPRGVWAAQTHGEEATPRWVAADSAPLAGVLGDHWHCPVRELDEDALAATFGGER